MRRALVLLFFAGCATNAVPYPSASQVARARARWPDATRASLEHGRKLYVARCSGCHTLYAPTSRAAPRWAAIVEEMAPRAKLSPHEAELVTRYLVAVSDPEPHVLETSHRANHR